MTASGATLFDTLWRLKDLPDWLRPERLKSAARAIDKAVTKGVLHRNTASRKISRLTRAVRSLAASS